MGLERNSVRQPNLLKWSDVYHFVFSWAGTADPTTLGCSYNKKERKTLTWGVRLAPVCVAALGWLFS